MKLRKNPLPNNAGDIACFLLIGLGVPTIVIWDIFIVLPAVYEPGSFMYNFTFVFSLFLLFNLVSNMLFCILVDTSYDPKILEPPQPGSGDRENWHHCESCNCLAPPRAWHCKTCGICILKRDHHCIFTGCCVGHKNHRYFMLYVGYLVIGSFYALAYNLYYLFVIRADIYTQTFYHFHMFTMPILLLRGYAVFMPAIFLMLNLVAVSISACIFLVHFNLVRRSAVFADKDRSKFDLGLYRNLQSTFGTRVNLVWISPFIKSPLPDDGFHWPESGDQRLKEM